MLLGADRGYAPSQAVVTETSTWSEDVDGVDPEPDALPWPLATVRDAQLDRGILDLDGHDVRLLVHVGDDSPRTSLWPERTSASAMSSTPRS